MKRRLHPYSLGVAIAASIFAPGWALLHGSGEQSDPHQPRPRSKGEKARNRKHRGGRP